jgi:hypothetical protein
MITITLQWTLRYVPDRTLQKKEEDAWDQGRAYSISHYRYQTWCLLEDVMDVMLLYLQEEKRNERYRRLTRQRFNRPDEKLEVAVAVVMRFETNDDTAAPVLVYWYLRELACVIEETRLCTSTYPSVLLYQEEQLRNRGKTDLPK